MSTTEFEFTEEDFCYYNEEKFENGSFRIFNINLLDYDCTFCIKKARLLERKNGEKYVKIKFLGNSRFTANLYIFSKNKWRKEKDRAHLTVICKKCKIKRLTDLKDIEKQFYYIERYDKIY